MSADEQLTTRLATLESAVANLSDVIAKLNTGGQGNEGSHVQNEPGHDETPAEQSGAAAEAHVNDPSNPEPDAIEFPCVQKEYTNIRDTLSRIKLPNNQRLSETGLGISKKDRPTFAVIQKNSRYLETGLKLLQLAQADESVNAESAQYLSQLGIVLQAAIAFNQQEYQALLVGSQFDPDTTRLFRVMQKSENCFSPQALTQLKLAAEIASVHSHSSARDRPSYTPSAGTNYRGRGRGRSNFYDRQQHYNRGYNQFTRGRPPQYPPNAGDQND